MNLENYKNIPLVAVRNTEDGKFSFCCQANEEGVKACKAMVEQANAHFGKERYEITYLTTYIKEPQLIWK